MLHFNVFILFFFFQKAGFTPNMTIYNTLSWRSENDFYYKIEILKSMKANDVGPDRNFLHHMERAVETGRRHVYELVSLC